MTDFQKFKRTHLISILICVGLFVVALVAFMFVPAPGWVGVVEIAIGLFAIVGVVMLPYDFLRHRVIFCKDCGHKFDYEKEVGYDQRDEVVYNKKRVATVDFECRCSKCGAAREFSRKFTTAYIDDKGKVHYYNLRKEIKNLFKG